MRELKPKHIPFPCGIPSYSDNLVEYIQFMESEAKEAGVKLPIVPMTGEDVKLWCELQPYLKSRYDDCPMDSGYSKYFMVSVILLWVFVAYPTKANIIFRELVDRLPNEPPKIEALFMCCSPLAYK